MPAVVPFIPLIAAGVAGGTSIYGAHKVASTNRRAMDLQAQSDARAQALLEQQEATRKAEYDRQVAEEKAAFDAEQARRAPYREAGFNSLVRLSQLAGLPTPAMPAAPTFTPSAPGTVIPSPTTTPRPGTMPLSALLNPRTSRTRSLVPALQGGY